MLKNNLKSQGSIDQLKQTLITIMVTSSEIFSIKHQHYLQLNLT